MFMLGLAVFPVLQLFFQLAFMRHSLFQASLMSALSCASIALIFWGMPFENLLPIFFKGIFLAGDIGLLLGGALVFSSVLKKTGYYEEIRVALGKFSSRVEVQILFVAWLFGSFIEGISGFGTPAALVGPLLVGVGFQPFQAVVVCLLANSSAVTFGALATPLRIGMNSYDWNLIAPSVPFLTFLPSLFVPTYMVHFIQPRLSFLKKLFLGFLAGMCFWIPYALFTRFSFEFASIFGGLIGFLIFFSIFKSSSSSLIKMGLALGPYLVCLLILLLGRLLIPTAQVRIQFGKDLSHSLALFHPGLVMIFISLALFLFKERLNLSSFWQLGRESLKPVKKLVFAVFFIALITYLYPLSAGKKESLSMLSFFGDLIGGPFLKWYTAFIGGLGAVFTGSATVSNLLFSRLLAEQATLFKIPLKEILSLQLVGAAAGNMMALPNLIAAQAAVGLRNQEREFLKILFIPCLCYLFLATLSSYLSSY